MYARRRPAHDGKIAAVRLSVLDLAPVRTDQSSADALAASMRLAALADDLGYTRYWVAEHHNVASVAATSPAVLIAMIGAATSRLRIGSGGVMLPNHAPLAVAEQFALLEAAYPGRVDLGIGRAAGADPVTSMVLRGPVGRSDRDIDAFPDHLDDVIGLLGPAGVSVQLPDRQYVLRSTPRALTTPRVFVLGSSLYSAQVAAAKGLPYVFGYHLFGQHTAEALALYRSQFVPSETAHEPVCIVTVNTVVAETRSEAMTLALPHLQLQAQAVDGAPAGRLDLADDAGHTSLTAQQSQIAQAELERAVVATPAEAMAQLRELAARFEVDEVMLNPVASTRRGSDPATAPERESTLRLLAGSMNER